nr:uncharacterized protein LOC109173369 [Ipomoea batatas]
MECVTEKESKPRILTGFDRRQSSLVAPPLRCFNPRLRWPVVMVATQNVHDRRQWLPNLSFTIIIDNSSISMTNEDKYGATLEVLRFVHKRMQMRWCNACDAAHGHLLGSICSCLGLLSVQCNVHQFKNIRSAVEYREAIGQS